MIKFLASPLFLLLALMTSLEPIYLCALPGPLGFIGTMWFMYLVMAIVHTEPWIAMIRRAVEQRRSDA